MNYPSLRVQILVVALLFCPLGCEAQQELGGAKILTDKGNTIVSPEEGRPLYYASLALSETYGWIVNYEDPVYSNAETKDATDQKWRREHPNGRSFYAPADRKFTANIGRVDKSNPNELDLLNRLVEVYNHTDNPGSFQIIQMGNSQLVVLGRSHQLPYTPFTPALDQQMRPSPDSESASDALQRLASQCGSAGEVPIELGTIPINALRTSSVSGFKEIITCREQLSRI